MSKSVVFIAAMLMAMMVVGSDDSNDFGGDDGSDGSDGGDNL